MNLALFARPAFRLAAQAAEFVFDRFIRQPLHGLVEVSEALVLLLPDLAEATVTAVVQAVGAQLSTEGRDRVRCGMQQLGRGLKQMVWPVALVVAILLCQLSGGFWMVVLAALLTLATVEREVVTVGSRPLHQST